MMRSSAWRSSSTASALSLASRSSRLLRVSSPPRLMPASVLMPRLLSSVPSASLTCTKLPVSSATACLSSLPPPGRVSRLPRLLPRKALTATLHSSSPSARPLHALRQTLLSSAPSLAASVTGTKRPTTRSTLPLRIRVSSLSRRSTTTTRSTATTPLSWVLLSVARRRLSSLLAATSSPLAPTGLKSSRTPRSPLRSSSALRPPRRPMLAPSWSSMRRPSAGCSTRMPWLPRSLLRAFALLLLTSSNSRISLSPLCKWPPLQFSKYLIPNQPLSATSICSLHLINPHLLKKKIELVVFF
mmetsp:Transcript_12893/g.21036  ORF Transcript_12893/g.21036 Transcript_12893/m.21036 type:complete len:300 (-) Transcript_12893:10-909(-)